MAHSPIARKTRSPSPRKVQSRSRSRSRSSPRNSRSPSPRKAQSRSRSRSGSCSRSRSSPRQRPRSRSRSPGRSSSPVHGRNSRSPSPRKAQSRSRSRSRSRPRLRSTVHGRVNDANETYRSDPSNPGETLYVGGLSLNVTDKELEAHFSREGKVSSCYVVVDSCSLVSRGYAFVTMESVEAADRCIKNLNQSILRGLRILVERSRRNRPRPPSPGQYLGKKAPWDYGPRGLSSTSKNVVRSPRGGAQRSPNRGRTVVRSPRGGAQRSPYRGRTVVRSPRGGPHSSPYGGRTGRGRYWSHPPKGDRSKSHSHSPRGSPARKYARRSR